MKTFEKFIENQDNFIPLNMSLDRMYYKVHIDKSIDKLNTALNKLGILKKFYDYYIIKKAIDRFVENNVIYLLIDFYDHGDYDIDVITDYAHINTQYDNIYGRKYGGEIFVKDYEIEASKYNL